jgi:hypothetical protein
MNYLSFGSVFALISANFKPAGFGWPLIAVPDRIQEPIECGCKADPDTTHWLGHRNHDCGISRRRTSTGIG